MIESHKRLLLSECREHFGRRSSDSVRVICDDGHTYVNVLVLVGLVPWLKEALQEQQSQSSFYPGSDLGEDPCLVVKSLRLSDLKTFMKHILTPIEMVDNRTFYGQDLFERSIIIKVLQSFSIFDQSVIFSFDDTSLDDVANDILFEENCSTVELQDIPTNTSTHLDPMQLSDKTIIDNFSNQDGQLVCLVCYKIFLSNSDFSTFRKHLSEHSLPIRKWGHLLSETLSEAPSSKSKLMEPPKPFLKTFKVRDPKWYSCTDCCKKFKKLTLLNQHKYKLHGQTLSLAQYECSKCDFKSANLAGLKAHQRKHDEKSLLECQLCGRKFGESRCLESHVKSGICQLDNRRCKICSKVFVDPTRLKIHALTHTGEKPWSCGICGKSFSQRRSLKEHEVIHSERPHGCNFCEKRFVQKNHLKYHIASCHGGGGSGSSGVNDLKHVCKICSRSYAFPYQLRNHEAQHVNKLISHFRASEQETLDFEKKS